MESPQPDVKNSPPSPGRPDQSKSPTGAARYNREMLRRLKSALRKDPEADIVSLLPPTYSQVLKASKRATGAATKTDSGSGSVGFHDIRSVFSSTDVTTVIYQPSDDLNLQLDNSDTGNTTAILDLLNKSAVFHTPKVGSIMILQVSDNILVKITRRKSATTEHESLSYIQKHLPQIPVPRPCGLVQLGSFYLLFTSRISGCTLEDAWPTLDSSQKQAISSRLDGLLSEMRSHPIPESTSLGGVGGEGCQDNRRFAREHPGPINSIRQFEDFIYSGAKVPDLYKGLLRELMPTSSKLVFTHGDIRPANIMVEQRNGQWTVSGIIDWESSGIYPEYWEVNKMTNNLWPGEESDWYNYLPKSLSQQRYPVPWLVDRLLDRHMANS